jgi:hypothetical protein
MEKQNNLRYLLAKVRTARGKASDRLRQRANKRNKNRVGRLPTSEQNWKIILSDEVRCSFLLIPFCPNVFFSTPIPNTPLFFPYLRDEVLRPCRATWKNQDTGWTTETYLFNSRLGQEIIFSLFHSVQTGSETHQYPARWVPAALSLRVNRLRLKTHDSPFSAEVKNAWRYFSTRPYVIMTCLIKYRGICAVYSMTQQPLVGRDLFIIEDSRSLWGTPHSVGLLWKNDQPDAETFTWKHATQEIDILAPGGIWIRSPSNRLRSRSHWDRAVPLPVSYDIELQGD